MNDYSDFFLLLTTMNGKESISAQSVVMVLSSRFECDKKPEFLCSLLNNKILEYCFPLILSVPPAIVLRPNFPNQTIHIAYTHMPLSRVLLNLRVPNLARDVVLVDGRLLEKHVQAALVLG